MLSSESNLDKILALNLFGQPKKCFCLVQQISPEEINRYFIYATTFEDIHFNYELKKTSTDEALHLHAYIYEKTYLIISCTPMCRLFESIIQFILSCKKLNLLGFISNLDLNSPNENNVNFFKNRNSELVYLIFNYVVSRGYQ